ncbi:MAG: ribosome-associated translation inhibitor RaiA [Hyphomicrobiales bacterium]|nr:ribosome-associated translation inhibitor RaiA [Hyphomicrobiales bacterium]
MDLTIKGKGVDVGEALRIHIEDQLSGAVEKYFSRAHNASVSVSREAHQFRADISVHPSRGVTLQGHGTAGDAYSAFDSAVERITKQLRRYKRRLTDHHKSRAAEAVIPAQQYIMAPETDEEELPDHGQPAIIAELETEIATLSVGEAVMRMDLADLPVLMFLNRANGGLNVVYRRSDGNIGWIDPANTQQP